MIFTNKLFLYYQVWEAKAAKAKEQYTKDLESYNANGGGGEGGGKKAQKRGKKGKKAAAPAVSCGLIFIHSMDLFVHYSNIFDIFRNLRRRRKSLKKRRVRKKKRKAIDLPTQMAFLFILNNFLKLNLLQIKQKRTDFPISV